MNKTQAIVFFGIIVIAVITSIFILSKNGPPTAVSPSKTSQATTPQPSPASVKKTPGSKSLTGKSMAASHSKTSAATADTKKPVSKAPAPVKPTGGFASEKALMDALTKAIQNKKIELFFQLIDPAAISQSARAQLVDLLKSGALKLDPQQSLSAIGRSQNSSHWSIHLLSDTKQRIEIITDLARDPKGSWVVQKIRPLANPGNLGKTDKTMNAATAPSIPANLATGKIKISSTAENSARPDAMMVAYAFSKAVIDRDIKTARSLSDPKRLNNEKLAALLIALEEGEFRLKTDRSLIITLSRDDLTWAITRVESAQEKSEFGVEMNLAQDGRWLVSGLTFSKLISKNAAAAGGGDVAYTPIRKNPQGGDSLVLYFEFDNEKVSARTKKQLNIVAAILSEDKNRKLHINGHADAKGGDSYNVALSKRRTTAVRDTLIELGVNPEQVVTKAYGESRPLKPNFKADGSDNPTGRAQNRRTEIHLDF